MTVKDKSDLLSIPNKEVVALVVKGMLSAILCVMTAFTGVIAWQGTRFLEKLDHAIITLSEHDKRIEVIEQTRWKASDALAARESLEKTLDIRLQPVIDDVREIKESIKELRK